MNIAQRAAVTTATADRFQGPAFEIGKWDCGKMLIWHLRQMGRRPKVGPGGTWKTALGLKRWLAAHGGSGAAVLDGWGLLRIAPAAAIVGDIIELEGEPPFGAFGVALGLGRVLAYHEDAETAVIVQPNRFVAAWRV